MAKEKEKQSEQQRAPEQEAPKTNAIGEPFIKSGEPKEA